MNATEILDQLENELNILWGKRDRAYEAAEKASELHTDAEDALETAKLKCDVAEEIRADAEMNVKIASEDIQEKERERNAALIDLSLQGNGGLVRAWLKKRYG